MKPTMNLCTLPLILLLVIVPILSRQPPVSQAETFPPSGVMLTDGGMGSQQVVAATPLAQDSAQVVVRVYFRTHQQLNLLAAELDVWQVNRAEGYLVALVTRAEEMELRSQGLKVEVDAAEMAAWQQWSDRLAQPGMALEELTGMPGYPCYRTVEETYADLAQMAANHPQLATWLDIGDTWEKVMPGGADGYDVHALVLTNQAIPGLKPKFLLVAQIHGNEIAGSELATRFAESLVAGYGVDPDVTWLLDWFEFHLVPYINPDGGHVSEVDTPHRKNMDSDDGCNEYPYYGVDLNRNASFKWNLGGSSSNPCASTYRGPSAGSEPEIQAVQDYILSLFPDQRGPGDNDPAPLDATGTFISLHSAGEEVLVPWRWNETPTANDTQIATFGRKMGFYNDYEVFGSADKYAASGNLLDFPYGELGVMGVTFELGTAQFQSCSYFESDIVPGNLDAFFYALKAARRPYMNPAGPEGINVVVSPESVIQGTQVQLTATVDDTRYDSNGFGDEPVQDIAAARYSIDLPSWEGAITYPVYAVDGTFDETAEEVSAWVDTAGLGVGRHILFVEGQDADGNWGVPTAVFLWLEDGTPPDPPAAPTGLTATAITSSQIDLSWIDNADDELGFKIERCTGAGCTAFAQIATVGANVTAYSDTGLADATTYRYRVRANNLGGNSDYSNIGGATTPAEPVCQTIMSGQDSYIKEDNKTDNKGDDDELRIKTQAGKQQRPVLWFDLSSIPAGANVQSATMSLWMSDIKGAPVPVSAHALLESWAEMGVTWNHRDEMTSLYWTTAGGTYETAVLDTVQVTEPKNRWVSWDVGDAIGGWLGGDNYGVILEAPTDGTTRELKFRSRERGDVDERPWLEICYNEGTPPVAVDDSAVTDEDTAVAIDVLTNDSDDDGTLVPGTVTVVSGPSHGSTSVDPDAGVVTYTPESDWFGGDAFEYEVCDNDGACDMATVGVTVNDVNDAPVAVDDSAETEEDTAVVIDVLANDSDVDGTLVPLTVAVLSGPSSGSTSVDSGTGAVTYTPNGGFVGSDSFEYQVCDDDGACDSAWVDVTVNEPNYPPVAVDDSAVTDENRAVAIDVLTNDHDPDGVLVPGSVSVVSGPSHGTTSVDPDTGVVTYTPESDWFGDDGFEYEVCDNDGACDTATVGVTVNEVVGPPVCVVLEPGKNLGYDAYLKQDKPDDRKGGDSEMRVKTEAGRLQRALTRFDLSAVPGDATVASVRLWLWVKDLNGPAVEVNAHRVVESWNEPQVSWADRDKDAHVPWAMAGGTYDAVVVDSATISAEKVWASWDLTALGAGWLAGENYGVILEAPVSDPKTEVKFVSNDDGDADERPWLEVCYYP